MTSFDFFFIGILLAFAVGGLLKGFVSKLFGLVGLIASCWAGLRLGAIVEPFLAGLLVTDRLVRALLGSLVASVVVWIVFLVIGGVISRAVKGSAIAPVDRMLGMLLGAAQAVVVIGALVLVGQQFKLDQQDWWRKALFRGSGEQAAQMLDRVVDFKSLASGWVDPALQNQLDAARDDASKIMQDLNRPADTGTE